MIARFSQTLASAIKVGDMISEPSANGSFTIYTVRSVETIPRKSGSLYADRIRFGFDGDNYRYADPNDYLIAAVKM